MQAASRVRYLPGSEPSGVSRLPVPPATWPGESVPGGAECYRDDTAVAFVGRGGRRHWPAYLGVMSIEVDTGIRFRFRGVPKGGVQAASMAG